MSFNEMNWRDPPREYCANPIIHQMPEKNRTTLMDAVKDFGFGGVVTNPNWKNWYAGYEENIREFENVIRELEERGLSFWIYDENGYPSGFAGGEVLKGHPELEAKGFYMRRTVAYEPRRVKFQLDTSFIQPGDMEFIQCKPDFMGCNVYTASCVRSDGKGGWENVSPSVNTPWGGLGNQFLQAACCMYYGIGFIYEKYNLPIYITENGIDLLEWKTLNGTVVDAMRADYIERYLSWLMKAKEAGVDIRGYYAWSLMDNFEWSSGFSRRFGLVYVDFDTKERTPKSSYYHYKGLIERYQIQQ